MSVLSRLRPEEWLVLAAGLFGAALLLGQPGRVLRLGSASAAAALVVWQLALRGLHWQFAPVLGALLLVAVLLFEPRRLALIAHAERPRVRVLLAGLCAVLTLGSGMMAWVLPLFRLPVPSGPFLVGTRTLHLTDPATGRELVTQIWYPAAAPTVRLARYTRLPEARPTLAYMAWIRTNSFVDAPVARGPFPLLLFGHRWAGRRNQDTALAEELASRGYVVASPDHPGAASRVELAGGHVLAAADPHRFDPPFASAAGVEADWQREQAMWLADDRFLLQVLAAETQRRASWLAGALDLGRIGAFGHSFGGSVSLALLGASTPGEPQVQSAVNLDGWSFGALEHRTAEPVLILYGGDEHPADATDSALDQADAAAIAQAAARRPGIERETLPGFAHADFTDAPLYSPLHSLIGTGSVDGVSARETVTARVADFFNRTLIKTP